MHWSGTQTKWDRNAGVVELFGDAMVNQPGETLTADYIRINLETKKLLAKGNAVYVARETILRGDEIDFDMVTRTGLVRQGRLTNGLFLLQAEEIEKLGPFSYRTRAAEYTTCSDCPGSWSFFGEEVELEVEGYAKMKNVTSRVKEAPVFWLPYLIIPVKRNRQTGFLFPRFRILDERNGFMFVLPFFWAINRSADMTISPGRYTKRGKRLEWEGRYALTDRSGAISNVYYTEDSNSAAPRRHRLATKMSQIQELPGGVEERLSVLESSDNLYPIDFPEDIRGKYEPVLSSKLSLSTSQPWYSAYIEARRDRNLLNFDEKAGFDPKTVQSVPSVLVTTNDQKIPGIPVVTGLSAGFTNFARSGGPFDADPFSTSSPVFRPGIDPIRSANRMSLLPMMYTVIRPWGLFSMVPSVQYRNYYYTFGQSMPNLSHGYVHTKFDLSMEWNRIYERDDPEVPRIKHVMRPTLTYSRIPHTRRPDHPFLRQIEYKSGYNFDNYDIVPLGTSPSLVNYFVPQGNSLSYGFMTRLILKRYDKPSAELAENGKAKRAFGRPMISEEPQMLYDEAKLKPSYERLVEFTGGQTIDFLELRKPGEERIPLSRFYSNLNFATGGLSSSTDYNFYPNLGRYPSMRAITQYRPSPHELKTSLAYTFVNLSRDVFIFQRSIGLSYTFNRLESRTSSADVTGTFSINDYLTPSASAKFDFLDHDWREIGTSFLFRPPSRCWQVAISKTWSSTGSSVSLDLSLNLTGSSYSGFGEIDPSKSN